jgi:hypothetical protein
VVQYRRPRPRTRRTRHAPDGGKGHAEAISGALIGFVASKNLIATCIGTQQICPKPRFIYISPHKLLL